MDAGSVYAKTALGVDELANHSRGLNPRMRQLLILVDGHRVDAQLARLIPRMELESYLPSLEAAGFIVRTSASPEHRAQAEPEARASADTQANSLLDHGHEELSQRLVTALLEVAGAHGGELANRIRGCQSRREVRAFLPAALSIVEIVAGQDGIRVFQERAGLR